jgi:hypothetical protein
MYNVYAQEMYFFTNYQFHCQADGIPIVSKEYY